MTNAVLIISAGSSTVRESRCGGHHGCRLPAFARWLAVAVAVLMLFCNQAQAQDIGDLLGGGGDSNTADMFQDLQSDLQVDDMDLLVDSHISDVRRWEGVQPARKKDGDETKYAWRTDAPWASPISSEPIRTKVSVPHDGSYRIWMRYRGDRGREHPVTLTLSGANSASHVYHARPMDGRSGNDQEAARPVRFEEEFHLVGVPVKDAPLWEFWDVDLKQGDTIMQLQSSDKAAMVDCIFITRSKRFIPGKGAAEKRGKVDRTYYRVRVTEVTDGSDSFTLEAPGVTYHWRWIQRGNTEPTWYFTMSEKPFTADGRPTIKVKQWTDFLDTTYASSASGPWATAYLNFDGIKRGKAEVQLCWYSNEHAVTKTVEVLIESGRALLLVPLDTVNYTSPIASVDAERGVWGMRDADYISWLQTAMDVYQRHTAYLSKAMSEVAYSSNPLPTRLKLSAGNRAAPALREKTNEMLRDLGVTIVHGTSQETSERLGLQSENFLAASDALYNAGSHCPLDPMIYDNLRRMFEGRAKDMERWLPGSSSWPTTLKMGDEIGAIVSATHINRCSDCTAAFHRYLHQQLDELDADASFFGVSDLKHLRLITHAPHEPAGIFEKRLHYFTQRYVFINTANFYKVMTAAAESVFAHIHTYCNFSPHPPMFGGTMNHSDWFALTREGGATMGWGEDWAGGSGSWSMAGIGTIGYYAAWVACAARRGDGSYMPIGFYNVINMGQADRKLFSLIGHGVTNQVMYSFGPRYAGAEFSNFWDEREGAYSELVRSTRAIGPADEIVAEGARPAATVALLYNRSHEIWQGAYAGSQTDRLLTFIALEQTHQPIDIILEDDLRPEVLQRYRAVYIQGMNLADEHLRNLQQWVSEGGVLVATAGTAVNDRFNVPSRTSTEFFGATQRIVGVTEGSWHALQIPTHEAIDTITLDDSPLTEALSAPVVGMKVTLEPTSAAVVGRYSDGTPAAVMREIGKGKVLLLGVQPGLIFKGKAEGSNNYTVEHRTLVTAPVARTQPLPRVTHSEPAVMVHLFEHASGLAVLVNDGSYKKDEPGQLSIDAGGRTISKATSTVRGQLEFEVRDGRIVVDCPVPSPVDVIILR